MTSNPPTATADRVSRVLILGSTGNVGRHVVATLLRPDWDFPVAVVAAVNDASSARAEGLRALGVAVVRVDLLDEASLRSALAYTVATTTTTATASDTSDPTTPSNQNTDNNTPHTHADHLGFDSVFLCLPQAFSPTQMGAAHMCLGGAMAAAGVHHLVKISSLGVDGRSGKTVPGGQGALGAAHAAGEALLARLYPQVLVTSIRPTSFSTNFLYDIPSIREGFLKSPLGTARVNWIDVRDIGAAAAIVLTKKKSIYMGQVLDITGPAGNSVKAEEMVDLVNEVRAE
eukprot:CAMPEP_0173239838 /NCGR_PEP_ID=MMETSP1142-20121109/13436_1 /TAXON_ID=483371 /ORGANISM="non described non described, Strain CCMP2298" /LENGTH=286 /DNA_ID=CAMNT_0014170899 /DNA_START=59 /DNA_END=916 /DNA_ORIENTATION=+